MLDQLRFLEHVQRGEQARPPEPDRPVRQGLTGRAAAYVHVGD
ncbi:hypothetical protein [Streptomyces olivochromogenes]